MMLSWVHLTRICGHRIDECEMTGIQVIIPEIKGLSQREDYSFMEGVMSLSLVKDANWLAPKTTNGTAKSSRSCPGTHWRSLISRVDKEHLGIPKNEGPERNKSYSDLVLTSEVEEGGLI